MGIDNVEALVGNEPQEDRVLLKLIAQCDHRSLVGYVVLTVDIASLFDEGYIFTATPVRVNGNLVGLSLNDPKKPGE